MPHTYTSVRGKRADFWAGFVGWVVGNGALVLFTATVLDPNLRAGASGLLILLNIGALIAAAVIRQYVAMGIALAFAAAFALTLVEGVFFTASDFAGGLSNTGIQVGFFVAGAIIFAIGGFFALRAIHRGIT
ncbi:MAG TPA: hypothetical protein VGX22_07215 [Candidatus Dormibacteraeota bacterium]|nr:hypothetical protein [Candidatus Dormibacteraeota bacterium]